MQYKILRREVENVFSNTYSYTPLIQYEGISDMTFSNGSVIATSTALFGSKQLNKFIVKNIFVSNYELHPSMMLDLNISYTADQVPTPATLSLEQESQTSTPHSNETVTTAISANVTVNPSNLTTASSNHLAANHSASPGGNVSEKPSGPEVPGTAQVHHSNPSSTTTSSTAEQGVPGWGVALLVLAAIILFLLLLLFILLLLCWCCWWRRRGFMNVSDPDPPGYYNPDIPMYSTHSTFDSHNGKSPQDSDSEKPPKNRTGMYVVNK
ncbi:hypothetical protein MHYP_G00022340 [Metynnis hypsauchen]